MAEERGAFRELIDALTGNPRAPHDWRSLIALASETLTIGSLADALLAEGVDIAIPADARTLLTDVRDRALRRNELAVRQFRELLPPLNRIGIRPIIMKGLARLLGSSDEQSRILSDIDLLVPAEHRNDCVRALADLGYAAIVGGEDDSVPPVLARSRDAGTVDLHTRIKPADLGLGYGELAPHCSIVELAEGAFLLPNATCQLILEVIHDQLHDRDYWRGLVDVRHLVDVHRLIGEGVDWSALTGFFPAGAPKRALELQMLTARSLSGVDIPDRYCGGAWTRLQMARRSVQRRFPKLRAMFTLLTIAADPPRRFAAIGTTTPEHPMPARQKAAELVERYILRAHPGKL